MADTTILNYDPISTPGANDYLVIARVGSNKKMRVSDLFDSASLVNSFNTRTGDVVLVSADLNGLSGAGLTGIGTGTGGVINTGTTTIGADSDSDSIGVIAFQTRGLTRAQVANNGTLAFTATTNVPLMSSTLASGLLLGLSLTHTLDSNTGPIELVVASGNNPGGLRKDTYYQFGHNPRLQGDGVAHYWATELHYNPGGVQVQTETYLQHTDPLNGAGAVNFRPMSFTIREDIQNCETVFFTSSFRLFTWPDPGADHGFIQTAYPHLDIEDGYLRIDQNLRAGAAEKRGINMGGLSALEFDRTNSTYYLGDSSLTITPKVACYGNVLIGSAGDAPEATRQLFVKTRSNTIDDVLWLLNNNTADNYLTCQDGGGAIHFKLTTAGVLQIWDGADLNTVTFGAADSAGTGFRTVKIPN